MFFRTNDQYLIHNKNLSKKNKNFFKNNRLPQYKKTKEQDIFEQTRTEMSCSVRYLYKILNRLPLQKAIELSLKSLKDQHLYLHIRFLV